MTTTAGNKVYVGDVGTEILVDTGVALATATVLELHVMKPGATAPVTWTGTISGATSISYLVIAADLDVAGDYTVQPYLEMPDWKGHGHAARFHVWPEFN